VDFGSVVVYFFSAGQGVFDPWFTGIAVGTSTPHKASGNDLDRFDERECLQCLLRISAAGWCAWTSPMGE